MDTAAIVFDFARSLLDDPERSWATDEYLRSFLNLAWRGLANELGACRMGFDERIVVLPNLGAGTQDLSAYLLPGQPLATLWQPIEVWERPAGGNDTQWHPMQRVAAIVPDLPPQPCFGVWEYREGNLWFPPSSQPIDLQIRFEEIFPALADATQPLRIAGAGHILGYSVAALAARSRGQRNMAADYAEEAQRHTGLLMLRLGKEMQNLHVRPRPYGDGGGC